MVAAVVAATAVVAAAVAAMVVAAALPPRIYVRFVIDESEWRERGWTSGGRVPHSLEGVARCVAVCGTRAGEGGSGGFIDKRSLGTLAVEGSQNRSACVYVCVRL